MLDPPTNLHQVKSKLWKDSICKWLLEQPGLVFGLPSFCLKSKLSHALDGLFNVLSRLHGRKHKCVFCWMKHHWTWQLSDCCLGFFLAWNPLFASWYRCCDGHFSGFGKYIFPQLQTSTALALSADCTEGSCSSNYIIVIFNNFLVFNFPFFDFEQ